MYQRTVREWEKQRSRLENEYRELVSRVDYLSDEVPHHFSLQYSDL